MPSPYRLRCFLFASVLLVAGGAARAAGSGADEPGQSSPEYQKAMAAIKAERWKEAIGPLESYTSRATKDADGFNWLGYAYRKSGQLKPAFAAYRRALQIDPRHLGAHEYVGEAYLMDNQPAKAEEHLAQLEKLCKAACEQYDDLKKAIAAYRADPSKTTASK